MYILCVCVCVCVYMHTNIYLQTHTHTHTHISLEVRSSPSEAVCGVELAGGASRKGGRGAGNAYADVVGGEGKRARGARERENERAVGSSEADYCFSTKAVKQ